jgi:hypothetical protein
MRVLVACEESQAVSKAFRALGHEAYSCDIQECSGGHPEWHLRMDARKAIMWGKWDRIIMHPPCTKVSVSGNGTYANTQERVDAANWNADLFFLACLVCDYVAMEQPVTVLRSIRPDLPKPHYVDLWWFGTRECKKTAWYLKGLPPLQMTNNVGPPPTGKERIKWMKVWTMSPSDDRGKLRSKLDPNLANAMALQWGGYADCDCQKPWGNPRHISNTCRIHA